MTEDRLNQLFDLTGKQPEKVSAGDVEKWVHGALMATGILAVLKLLLTKKMIMIGTISSVCMGIAATAVVVFTSGEKEVFVRKVPETSVLNPKPVAVASTEHKKTQMISAKRESAAVLPVPGKMQEFLPQVMPLGNRITFPEIQGLVPAKEVSDVKGEFTRIEADGFVHFKLVQGEESKISLNFSGDRNAETFDYEIKDDVLVMKGKEENKAEEIIVTVKNLEKMELNGFCSVEASEKMTFRTVEIELDGFSKAIILGDAEKLEADLNGDSRLEYTGSAKTIDIDVDGMSDIIFNCSGESMKAEVNGASSVSFNGDVRMADIEANGASDIRYSGNAGKFELESNGSSKIQLSGSSDEADIDLNGTGKLLSEGFRMQNLAIEMNGDCEGTVQVSGTLDAELNGMSSLTYTGSPQVVRQEVQKFCKLKQH